MSRQFLTDSIPELIGKLSVDEKISLLGAPNWWNTNKIDRLHIPAARMSDGPNGVRGSSHFLSSPAQCIPCATSLASTFDTTLIQQVGAFLAEEAKTKSAVVLLAPTCNIQRSPLGGRAFESFSEDPFLSGSMAAAYVHGLQSNGVASTIKHLVANDQEHERTAVNSVVSERALREVYLYPFMIAQRDSKPWAYMTSYGRIDGIHCSENHRLLEGILRGEWGFEGLIMSDWFGTYGVDEAIKAGLDLEMPGPPRWRTPLLINHLLTCQKLDVPIIEERATKLLSFVQKVARASPEVVYGDGVERTRDSPESRAFNRKVAAEGMVLLKNRDGLLPLSAPKKIAVIGPNAKGRVISGGGSAFLRASYIVTPWAGIENAASKETEVHYTVGCYAHKFLPTLEDKLTTPKGESGWLCVFYSHDSEGNPSKEIASFVLEDTRVKLNDFLPEGLTPTWSLKLTGDLKVDRSAPFEFGLTVAGRAKLFVNGKLTIDNWTKQRPGEFFYGQGSAEEKEVVHLTANQPVRIEVEYTNTLPPDSGDRGNSQPALMRGVRLGGCEKIDPDQAIHDAVKLAAESDVAIVVAGLTHEWESEGFDRPNLDLPGRQAELIRKVSAANPKTIVVVQAGSAVDLSWVDGAGALIQAWYSGNEVGNAIADVLFGKINPSGRLPLTLPKRVEDIPAHLNFRSENGQVHYQEDIFVGYKHYLARKIEPLFPFGFGLSYTSFSFSDLSVTSHSGADADSFKVEVSVIVTNTGKTAGSEAVQLYISPPESNITHVPLQLKAFAKVRNLAPGNSEKVKLVLDKYAVSYWHEPARRWLAAVGQYGVYVGGSSADLPLKGEFKVTKSFAWSGL